MSVIIGIDVGGSTTKIVGLNDKGGKISVIEPQIVRANDPVTATYGAFGKFTDENELAISGIDKIMMTGVGSSFVKHNLYTLTAQLDIGAELLALRPALHRGDRLSAHHNHANISALFPNEFLIKMRRMQQYFFLFL